MAMISKTVWMAVALSLTASAWAERASTPAGAGSASRDQGSEDDPKVLYIVPWQAPQSPELEVPTPVVDVEGVLRPLDRGFYRQSLHYRQHLKMGMLPDRE